MLGHYLVHIFNSYIFLVNRHFYQHISIFCPSFVPLLPFVFICSEPFWFSFHFLLCMLLFSRSVVSPWTAARQASPSFTISCMSIESVMTSNHLILFYPLLLLPSIFSSIRVFSNELTVRIMWPNYWSFSFSISSYNEYSELISLRIDWFDLLAVQGTLKESSPAPQFESINSFVFSLPYGPTLTSIYDYWKNHSPD